MISSNHTPRAVLWDLDGTIIDTAPAHWQAWKETLVRENFDLRWDVFISSFGMRNDSIIPMWLGPQISAADIERIGEAKEIRFRELISIIPLQLLPGVKEWLARLQSQGWRQAIATMAPRQNLERMVQLANIGPYLDAFATAEDVNRGKPEPDIFLAAAGRLGVPPARCVVVEDAPAGVEAARRAGMHSIGVGASIQPGMAERMVASLLDLPDDAFEQMVRSEM